MIANKDNVAWVPNPGSQSLFLSCPFKEVLYYGTRKAGKSTSLLVDFLQDVGKGFGPIWRGVLFRRTFPQLRDLAIESQMLYKKIFPKAEYNKSEGTWYFPDGETLKFAYMDNEKDYGNFHGHCVDKGDVLTKKGWKSIQDIRKGDRVLSVNKRNKLSYQEVEYIVKEEYSGDLLIYNGKGKYMSFTPNHRLPTIDNKLIEYNKLPRFAYIKNAGWELKKGKNLDINYCEFMGWFLSEGWTNKNGKYHYTIGISQSKKENKEKIKKILDNLKINYHENKSGFVWHEKNNYNKLSKFGKCRNKYVPKEIKRSNKKCLQAFFDSYVSGDGCKQKKRIYIYTTSLKMFNDLQEIGIKLGYSVYATHRQRKNRKGLSYEIAFDPKKELKLYTDNRIRNVKIAKGTQIERVKYKGDVYCLGVKNNHNFFIRQNGSSWLSGNSLPWIGWDELCEWPNLEAYELMKSCNFSSSPIPVFPRIRSTANTWGIGRAEVKGYFVDPVGRWGVPIENYQGEKRIAIFGNMLENIPFMENQGKAYRKTLFGLSDEELKKSWIFGSWDVKIGSFFADAWDERKNVIPISQCFIPPSDWFCFRSFDWGSASPFSIGWWCESDGNMAPNGLYYPRGALIRFAEWYGCKREKGKISGLYLSNEQIGKGIKEREKQWGNLRIRKGPADNQIFQEMGGESIHKQMGGNLFVESDKSRVPGWSQVRNRLVGGKETGPRLLIMEWCYDARRTLPYMQRDDKNLEDIDTNQEDHICDDIRYACMFRKLRKSVEILDTSDILIY